MKKKFFILVMCGGLLLLSFGCANLFKGKLDNLSSLLDSGDYAQVLVAANAILATSPNDIDALMAKGQAEAALEGVIFSDMLTKFNDASKQSGTQNIDDIFSGIGQGASTSNLLDACQNLNKADALSNLSSDDQLALAMINGSAGQKLHEEIWDVDDDKQVVTPLLAAGSPTYKASLIMDVKGPDGQYFSGDASTDLTDSSADLIWACEQGATGSGALDADQENEIRGIQETNDRKIAIQKAIDGIATAGTYNQSATTYIDNSGAVHDLAVDSSEAKLKTLIEDTYFN